MHTPMHMCMHPYASHPGNFFHSEGMPYPDAYTLDLWHQKQQQGYIKPTGCPENQRHSSC